MAKYVASMFIRDPLVDIKQYLNKESESDEFYELLHVQSQNMKNVILKVPVDDGWRVELKCLEVQLTTYENYCVITFVTLLVEWFRSLHQEKNDRQKDGNLTENPGTLGSDFYIPISLVEKNFARACVSSFSLLDYAPFRTADPNRAEKDESAQALSKLLQMVEKGEITREQITETEEHKQYGIELPKDRMKFFFKLNNKIEEMTIDEIMVPICEILAKKYPKYEKEIEYIEKKAKGELISLVDFIRYESYNFMNVEDPENESSSKYIFERLRRIYSYFYLKRKQEDSE